MSPVLHPYLAESTLRTQSVLTEVVDDQLREAAWSSLARLRQLELGQGTVAALRRREQYLRGHIAGLASVFDRRLARRLTRILQEPEDMPSEAFVAALLLLRCDRVHGEPAVLSAWAHTDCPVLQRHLGQAILHGGLREPDHRRTLVRLLGSSDVQRRRSAAELVAGLSVDASAASPALHALPEDNELSCTMLQLMAAGCLPPDTGRLAEARHCQDADVRVALEHALAMLAPRMLAQLARAQLDAGDVPGLWPLQALVAHIGPGDVPRLAAAAMQPGGARACHALGLTGHAAAARAALEVLGASTTALLADAALEAFAFITGLEEGDGLPEPIEAGWPCAQRAEALQLAWQQQPVLEALPRTWQGEAPSAAFLLRRAQTLTLERYQGCLRLLEIVSQRALCVPRWQLLEGQLAQLQRQAAVATLALQQPSLGPCDAPGGRGRHGALR